MARAKSYLFGFSKKIVGIPVENHLSDHLNRHELFRYQLRGVQNIKFEFVSGFLVKDLKSELEFRKIAGMLLHSTNPSYGSRNQLH